MMNDWLPLQSVLNAGSDVTLDDQSIWQGPIKEFGIDVRIERPIEAKVQLFPQEDGLLLRGHITGAVALPCRLCTEDSKAEIDYKFDSFEPFPNDLEDGELPDPDIDEYFIRLSPHGGALEINLSALAWEEFLEALPQYPLCRNNCAGLCPECGKNLNKGACDCEPEVYDLRMAKLRGLKINK